MSVARGCDLMGLPRSTYYDVPGIPVDDTEIVSRIHAVCDEFETYGYRRVGAALRHQGIAVNAKKVRRLMREHGLQPRRRTRFVARTDSSHNLPVFPNLAPWPEPSHTALPEPAPSRTAFPSPVPTTRRVRCSGPSRVTARESPSHETCGGGASMGPSGPSSTTISLGSVMESDTLSRRFLGTGHCCARTSTGFRPDRSERMVLRCAGSHVGIRCRSAIHPRPNAYISRKRSVVGV